jgi:hypothetical protein
MVYRIWKKAYVPPSTSEVSFFPPFLFFISFLFEYNFIIILPQGFDSIERVEFVFVRSDGKDADHRKKMFMQLI